MIKYMYYFIFFMPVAASLFSASFKMHVDVDTLSEAELRQSLETIQVEECISLTDVEIVDEKLVDILSMLSLRVVEETDFRVQYWFDTSSPILWLANGEQVVASILEEKRSFKFKEILLKDFIVELSKTFGEDYPIGVQPDGNGGTVFFPRMNRDEILALQHLKVLRKEVVRLNGRKSREWLAFTIFRIEGSTNISVHLSFSDKLNKDSLDQLLFLQGLDLSLEELVRFYCFSTMSRFYLDDRGDLIIIVGGAGNSSGHP